MASYAELQQGDRLPTVGVLQKLLNRTGATLRVDGVFGPKTRTAVVEFQKLRHLPNTDGVASQATWARLIFKNDLPILDCVDVFDPALYEGDAANIKAAGGDPLLMGGMSRGTYQAATDIVARARNVFLLRIIGHGGPGNQHVAWGAGGWDETRGKKKIWHKIHGDPLSSLHVVNAPWRDNWGSVSFSATMDPWNCTDAKWPKGRMAINLSKRLPVRSAYPSRQDFAFSVLRFTLMAPRSPRFRRGRA